MSVQGHHLDIVADVLSWVRLPIIRVERWAHKPAQHWGRSMSSKNGDRVALRKAQLIESMAAFLGCRFSGNSESRSVYSCERERSRCRWGPN